MVLSGKTILVTGGCGNLGRAVADAIVARGARLAVIDREREALQALAQHYPGAVTAVADLGNPDEVEAAVDDCWTASGTLDGLVNCAGTIVSAPLVNVLNPKERRHPFSLWQRAIADNLTSVFLVSGAVAERMITSRTRGVIVSISSVMADGNPGQTAYSAAKAGVIAMTRTWAAELGSMGIRAVAVAPGFVDTPSTRAALTADRLGYWQGRAALRKLVQPKDVALAVAYALENDAITGSVLTVDAGLGML